MVRNGSVYSSVPSSIAAGKKAQRRHQQRVVGHPTRHIVFSNPRRSLNSSFLVALLLFAVVMGRVWLRLSLCSVVRSSCNQAVCQKESGFIDTLCIVVIKIGCSLSL